MNFITCLSGAILAFEGFSFPVYASLIPITPGRKTVPKAGLVQ
jgi:hypothetical protein